MSASTAGADAKESSGLPRQAVQGAAVTFGGQIMRFALQFIGIIALSRILGPGPIGLFALVMVVVGLGEVLRDFGLSAAAIQAKTLSDAQRTNLFWINTVLGVILCLICIFVGPFVADYYKQDELSLLFFAISAIFILNGLSTQYRAGLTRDLRFTALAVIEVGSMALGLGAAIFSALLGAGIWALAVQQLVQAGAAMVLCVSLARWLPGLPRSQAEMRSLLNFGWNVGASQLVNYLSRNIDTVVIGRQFGMEALGLYNRAYQMLTLPLNQINIPATKVAFPVLSKVQHDNQLFRNYLLRAQSAITVAVSLIFFYCAAVAVPLIDVVLGEDWHQAAPIFQILACAGIVQSAAFATYWVFLAKGKTASSLRYTLFTKSILVASVLIGSNWGVFGVAAGYTIATAVSWPIGLAWIRKIEGAPVVAMANQSMIIFTCFAGPGIAAFMATSYILPENSMASLVIGTSAYSLTLALLYFSSSSIRRSCSELLKPLSHLKTAKKMIGAGA